MKFFKSFWAVVENLDELVAELKEAVNSMVATFQELKDVVDLLKDMLDEIKKERRGNLK
jgi:hypothetical protein